MKKGINRVKSTGRCDRWISGGYLYDSGNNAGNYGVHPGGMSDCGNLRLCKGNTYVYGGKRGGL